MAAFFLVIAIVTVTLAGALTLGKSTLFPKQPPQEELKSPSATPSVIPSLSPSPTPMVTEQNSQQVEITGTLNIVYGDPQDPSEPPRYRYSVTDNQGKSTRLELGENVKFIGGNSIDDFDRKKVKVKGSFKNYSQIFTITSIAII